MSNIATIPLAIQNHDGNLDVDLTNKKELRLCEDILSLNNVPTLLESDKYLDDGIIRPSYSFQKRNVVLYKIEEITFEEDSPRLEALENALSCMSVPGVNLIYLLLGDSATGGVNFYFGFARDENAVNKATDSVNELGNAFIKPALLGNFRGSSVHEIKGEEIENIHNTIVEYMKGSCEALVGVPGWVKEKDKQDFRGIDRLVDVMQGDEFGFMIIAKPINDEQITELRQDIFETYGLQSAMSKNSVQIGFNSGTNKNISVNTGLSTTKGKTITTGQNDSRSSQSGSSHGDSDNSHNSSTSKTFGRNKSIADNEGKTKNEGKTSGAGASQGTSITTSYEFTLKSAADWVKYFDEVLIPRLDYARGKGAFVVNSVLFGENPQVVKKLSNVVRSIFAGETANMIPMTVCKPTEYFTDCVSLFSIPCGRLSLKGEECLPYIHAGLLGFSGDIRLGTHNEKVLYLGNWMSVRELAIMAGLPQKEVIGMRLKEEVEFGLNIPKKDDGKQEGQFDQFELGTLVKSGNECKGVSVKLSKSQLDRHVFVAGVTGSGKTTTCQTLLLSTGWPFLVIEPAKTEYRGLMAKHCPNLLVFTLGEDNVAPFRLNPFELIPGESITSRVDMLMASITAAFDMEAAIPQLIESAIYECYKDYGWNIGTNQNLHYKPYNPDDGTQYAGTAFEDGVFAFPTLSDVLKKTHEVVNAQGFDQRLKKDYIGSINSRLSGLTLGAKGFMLNCQRSIDFMTLLDKQVVLELEPIPNAAQKSLIIGFVLTNLLQAIKKKFQDGNGEKVNHITLIEEAHRLLTKPEPGGNPSQKQAAETFADMLAEIRKYGESLIIADQIPGKLTPEVIKNTNTKIIHTLFAQDDKEAVGHTMGLEEEQANFLAHLTPGRAIVFNGKWPKAVQVQVTLKYDTSSKIAKEENKRIRDTTLSYYLTQCTRGVFGYSEFFENKPTVQDLVEMNDLFKEIANEFHRIPLTNQPNVHELKERSDFRSIAELVKRFGIDKALKYLLARFLFEKDRTPAVIQRYTAVFQAIIDESGNFKDCEKSRSSIARITNKFKCIG